MRNSRTKVDSVDDQVPDMKETGHSGKTNGGMYRVKADFGQTIMVAHPLDRSTMYGSEEDECGRNLDGGIDNLAHSLDGCKVSRAAVTGPDRGAPKTPPSSQPPAKAGEHAHGRSHAGREARQKQALRRRRPTGERRPFPSGRVLLRSSRSPSTGDARRPGKGAAAQA